MLLALLVCSWPAGFPELRGWFPLELAGARVAARMGGLCAKVFDDWQQEVEGLPCCQVLVNDMGCEWARQEHGWPCFHGLGVGGPCWMRGVKFLPGQPLCGKHFPLHLARAAVVGQCLDWWFIALVQQDPA